jgi:hypothetical protein
MGKAKPKEREYMLRIMTGERRVAVDYQGSHVVFNLAPENLDDQLQALKWAEDRDLLKTEIREGLDGKKGTYYKPSAMFSLERISFLRRTQSWEGLAGPDGEPLPCTKAMKILVFGQQPDLIMQLMVQLGDDLAAERKNSEPSQPG